MPLISILCTAFTWMYKCRCICRTAWIKFCSFILILATFQWVKVFRKGEISLTYKYCKCDRPAKASSAIKENVLEFNNLKAEGERWRERERWRGKKRETLSGFMIVWEELVWIWTGVSVKSQETKENDPNNRYIAFMHNPYYVLLWLQRGFVL